MKTIRVLANSRLNPDTLATLKETFDVTVFDRNIRDELSAEVRGGIQGVALFGAVDADAMDSLPDLEIISHFGVGYDGIDTAAALERGIMVTNTPDVLTEEVADTALGLLLNTVRELPRAEAYLRAGQWKAKGSYPLTQATLRGRRAGILGLGRIGMAIARRLEAFGLSVAYHNRRRRDDIGYDYYPSLVELAGAVDTLIIAAPGGAETDKAVNAEVLRALGPDGILVNIGRGTIVDEPALVEALESGTIRAAGLDVFANEPNVPEELLSLPNVVLTPHVASASRATRRAMGQLVVDNLKSWFETRKPLTPVAEMREEYR
ncbi:2-hydroxyacid dehydrogenase [Consotaella salsifontis]|nr:2-hydroxyacid dehydrogenase [Consotaella salsifontis]